MISLSFQADGRLSAGIFRPMCQCVVSRVSEKVRRSKRRAGREAEYRSNAVQPTRQMIRKAEAVVIESPMPVASAKYIAKQTGHFGINTSAALGKSHRKINP